MSRMIRPRRSPSPTRSWGCATAHMDGATIALARAYKDLPAGARIELGVRPEFATLRSRGAGLPVQVRRIDDLGRVRIARVELMGHAFAATIPDNVEIAGTE